MITPRLTRLVRVPDLRGMHRAILRLIPGGLDARRSAVIVPTRGAAVQLRRTLENLALAEGSPGAAMVFPDLLTRADFLARLHETLPSAPPLLDEFEREVLFRRAAHLASEAGAVAPFRLRPGLIVEILAFYDELRRRHRTIDAFDRLMREALEPTADIDRGAERLLRQTHFLTAAFEQFAKLVADSGRVDEHGLRSLLLSSTAPPPYQHVVVATTDQAADPRGLWLSDFDLLSRLPALERIDVVATERVLAAGFHQRLLDDLLPGIEEARDDSESAAPVLRVPEPVPVGDTRYSFISRDREEELADAARRLKADTPQPLDRHAIVFQRPLPYLYLARSVFADAGIPYQALDSLPLAAEPVAGALDVLFSFISAEATRSTLIEFASSPHWRLQDPASGEGLTRTQIAAADRLLRELKYLGSWERLDALAAESAAQASSETRDRRAGLWRRGAPVIRAAAAAGRALREAAESPRASDQLSRLSAFIAEHQTSSTADASWQVRELRARAAIRSAMSALRTAHARHDDRPVSIDELWATLRRWIEGHTFSPRTGEAGIHLLDAPAAAFADLDHLHIAGLVETDWPEQTNRSIFYPPGLLSLVGWHSDTSRLAAARARFLDLMHLPARTVSASTFTLEDDAIVAPSAFVEELETSGLVVERVAAPSPTRAFVHEAIAVEPVEAAAVAGDAAAWLTLRAGRSASDHDIFHGAAGPRGATVYAISHVERYLDCPFKYFAAFLLKLDEERAEESGLTPQERGQFLHDVFESFFDTWGARGAISAANLSDALAVFEEVAETRLATLGETDRALERTYLLGSAAAPGLAERAFAFEIEHGVGVIERLLEHPLEGTFVFEGEGGRREVSLRAKADRIDLLEDGTLRVIDYKLGRAPRATRALQLPIYGICAQQHLEGRHGRDWTLSRAGYVAFKEKNAFVSLAPPGQLDAALADGQERFLAAIAAIEDGRFPVDPDEPWLCTRCGFAAVCRKDYVGDE